MTYSFARLAYIMTYFPLLFSPFYFSVLKKKLVAFIDLRLYKNYFHFKNFIEVDKKL